MMLTAAGCLSRFSVRGELSGKGEKMIGNCLISPVFGCLATAEALKMASDDGHRTNGV